MRRVLVQVGGLAFFLGLTFLAAWAGGAATSSSVGDWYPSLKKPGWTPGGGVIGSVWTVLYLLMAVAAWLVWRKKPLDVTTFALLLWIGQLALNVLWSVIFFGMRNPGAAFGELVVLWILILATTVAFARISVPAGLLFVPYLAWVTFAGYLNWTIARMN